MVLNHQQVEKLMHRDEQLFNDVYEQTKKGVYAIVFSILKDHDTSNDIIQDVYMKMLIKIEQYKVGTNFFNWLAQIAKNQAIDHYRRSSKVIQNGSEMLDQMPSTIDQPDHEDQFNHLIELLDDDERMVVIPRIVDDMKFKDIAKLLKKPLGTVLWIYQKAMDKLKREMEV
ncbi:MAG: RNA polymerase sigma factor [Acholeplasmataceae bacterium]|nr:RNA polymerase sigma factor [Acholeplasmataceae bacterium]